MVGLDSCKHGTVNRGGSGSLGWKEHDDALHVGVWFEDVCSTMRCGRVLVLKRVKVPWCTARKLYCLVETKPIIFWKEMIELEPWVRESRRGRKAAQGPICEKWTQRYGCLREFTGEGGRPRRIKQNATHNDALCYPSLQDSDKDYNSVNM